jgi:hypothetical protein
MEHGKTTKTRARFTSQAAARAAGVTLANRLGRAVILSTAAVAVAVIASAPISRNARAADLAPPISVRTLADMPVPCSSVAECSAVAVRFGCVAVYPFNVRAGLIGRPHLECNADQYRRALARYSA